MWERLCKYSYFILARCALCSTDNIKADDYKSTTIAAGL